VALRATLHYSEALLRSAAFAYARRFVFSAFGVALAVVTAAFVALVGSGDRSWLVGVLGTSVVMAVGVTIATFTVRLRDSLATLARMPSRTAELVADDDRLCVTSEIGSLSMPWADVREVWRYADFWILVFTRRRVATLPLATLNSEARAFIAERVRAGGGRVGA
jgi:Na+/melibiose symporter-like transporter